MIETRDPKDLRPLPYVAAMPRWPKEAPEWGAFVEDIRASGICHPIQILPDGRVVDGETRRQAALALGLKSVPVEVVADESAAAICLRELVLRRNLSKGQLAYVAVPVLGPVLEAAEAAHLERLKTGNQKGQEPTGTEFRMVGGGQFSEVHTKEKLAETLGITSRLLRQAEEVHSLFAKTDATPFLWTGDDAKIELEQRGLDPETKLTMRQYYEPLILDPEHPTGLGAVIAGISSKLEQMVKADKHGIAHGGGKAAQPAEQLRLFTDVWDSLVTRYDYWKRMDPDRRKEATAKLDESLHAAPEDFLKTLKARVAAEIRLRKKGGKA